MSNATNNGLLDALTETANSVAAFTGILNQFIDAGWSKDAAEQMVIAMLRNAGTH